MKKVKVLLKLSPIINQKGFSSDVETEIEVKEGITLIELLNELQISRAGKLIIINGNVAEHSRKINQGDSIYILPHLDGG